MNKKQKRRHASLKLSDNDEVIDLPPLDPQWKYRICSPRLKHPEQMKDFRIEMIELPSPEAKA